MSKTNKKVKIRYGSEEIEVTPDGEIDGIKVFYDKNEAYYAKIKATFEKFDNIEEATRCLKC